MSWKLPILAILSENHWRLEKEVALELGILTKQVHSSIAATMRAKVPLIEKTRPSEHVRPDLLPLTTLVFRPTKAGEKALVEFQGKAKPKAQADPGPKLVDPARIVQIGEDFAAQVKDAKAEGQGAIPGVNRFPDLPPSTAPKPERCPLCGVKAEKMECNGTGHQLVMDEFEGQQYFDQQICPYKVALKIRANMDPSIRGSKPYAHPTPLLKEAHRFLFFESRWSIIARNIHNFILNQHDPLNFRVRITSDREILEVRLGNQNDEDGGRMGLTAFIQPYDLVVIRLGEIGYQNVAAAGYLYEAIMPRIRQDARLWVQCEPSDPYRPDHFAYSPALEHLFETVFKKDAQLKADKKDRSSH